MATPIDSALLASGRSHPYRDILLDEHETSDSRCKVRLPLAASWLPPSPPYGLSPPPFNMRPVPLVPVAVFVAVIVMCGIGIHEVSGVIGRRRSTPRRHHATGWCAAEGVDGGLLWVDEDGELDADLSERRARETCAHGPRGVGGV
jgi:hypothetical protein